MEFPKQMLDHHYKDVMKISENSLEEMVIVIWYGVVLNATQV